MAVARSRISSGDRENTWWPEGATQKEVALPLFVFQLTMTMLSLSYAAWLAAMIEAPPRR